MKSSLNTTAHLKQRRERSTSNNLQIKKMLRIAEN